MSSRTPLTAKSNRCPGPALIRPGRVSRRTLTMVVCAVTFAILALISVVTRSPPALSQSQSLAERRPLIFVPGLLGSRLCRPDPNDPTKPMVVWGTLGALSEFPTLGLSRSGAAPDQIRPCGLVREIVYLGLITQDVHAPVIAHLEHLGYREQRDLFV